MSLVARDTKGRYLPGNPPGPGRPRGSRPKLVTALREALEEDETLERLRAIAIQKMEEGDPAFWKMLLDRVWPAKMDIDLGVGERTVALAWIGDRSGSAESIDAEAAQIEVT